MKVKVQIYSDEGQLIVEHHGSFPMGIEWNTSPPLIENNLIVHGYEFIPKISWIKKPEEELEY